MARSSALEMRIVDTSNTRSVSKFAPSYRNASPNGPWPWMDMDAEVDDSDLSPVSPLRRRTLQYRDYPQNLFRNWTAKQVKQSGIHDALSERNEDTCTIYNVDVLDTGKFRRGPVEYIQHENQGELWEAMMAERDSTIRIRAIFIDNMSGPVLKIFGTNYNIEPFYWSSALNHIPAKYQEDLHPGEGDHITITLTFLKSIESKNAALADPQSPPFQLNRNLDPHAPLSLYSTGRILMLDEMALHMIRSRGSSTMLSYHTHRSPNLSSSLTSSTLPGRTSLPQPTPSTTTAEELHKLVRLAGQSVYWRKIFNCSRDPTLVLLTTLWHPLYSWDQALASLYAHVQTLETSAIRIITSAQTREIHEDEWAGREREGNLTGELHIIRGHLLFYLGLLKDFRRSVEFVKDVPNPAMDPEEEPTPTPNLDTAFSPDPSGDANSKGTEDEQKARVREAQEKERDASRVLLVRECDALLAEIDRLEMTRDMLDSRVKNVMDLVFATVNIADSRHAQVLSEMAARDSSAMKQIAYLTMIFLPASFVATVFGMNLKELNGGTPGIDRYLEVAIPMTAVTVWIIIALQSKWHLNNTANGGQGGTGASLWGQLWWPLTSVTNLVTGPEQRKKAGRVRSEWQRRGAGLT
ncbi:hypothetical protein FIBSPDRAFT_829434 [Athelia psychrophila]|uniref:Cora-domain-containing protein n=1 Tax=Athelia psychrophila TaxID=1759441 RepID=A0A166H1B8_9AGAM|nr:hypothetical protein FIBSPDRAFT_829434 [Fibularhizoctonia sp. CBS 109695]